MRTIDEIREGFASIKNIGARRINTLPDKYPAYIIRISDGYGVAVAVDDTLEISERFNSCKFNTRALGIDGNTRNYLILSSAFEEFRHEFAALCTEFVEPGEHGANRVDLLENPLDWWKRWKELVGNTSREQRVYNVIAEMVVLNYLFKSDFSIEWAAAKSGSHDIEGIQDSYEVKSTIKRYGASITISGQYQLECNRRLWLYFCRMEESLEGSSINDMQEKLVSSGYDGNKLEMQLERLGFEHGSSIRNKKYKVIEIRKYEVDEKFPKIVKESFKDDKIPDSIIHIEYTIDLDGLKYEIIDGNNYECTNNEGDSTIAVAESDAEAVKSDEDDVLVNDSTNETYIGDGSESKDSNNVKIVDQVVLGSENNDYSDDSDSVWDDVAFWEDFKTYCKNQGYEYLAKSPIIDEKYLSVYLAQPRYRFELRVDDVVRIRLCVKTSAEYQKFKEQQEKLEELLGKKLRWMDWIDESYDNDEDDIDDEDEWEDDEDYGDTEGVSNLIEDRYIYKIAYRWEPDDYGKKFWNSIHERILRILIKFHNSLAELGLLYVIIPDLSVTNDDVSSEDNSRAIKFVRLKDEYGFEKAKNMIAVQLPLPVTKDFDYNLLKSEEEITFEQGLKIKELSDTLGVSVQTIIGWYRWRDAYPDNKLVSELPDYLSDDDYDVYDMIPFWTSRSVTRFKTFVSSIPDRTDITGEIVDGVYDLSKHYKCISGSDFIQDLDSCFKKIGYRLNTVKKTPKNTLSSEIGRPDYYLLMEAANSVLRLSIILKEPQAVERLDNKKEAIESILGEALFWGVSSNVKCVKTLYCEKAFENVDFNTRCIRFSWMIVSYVKLLNALSTIGEIYVRLPMPNLINLSGDREYEALRAIDRAVLIHDLGWEKGSVVSIEKYGDKPFEVNRNFDFDLLRISDSEKDERAFPENPNEYELACDEMTEDDDDYFS